MYIRRTLQNVIIFVQKNVLSVIFQAQIIDWLVDI